MDERVAVFDLGMVLVTPRRLFEGIADVIGVAPSQVKAHYWTHRDAYDGGRDDRWYWSRTLPLMGAMDVDLEKVLPRLLAADAHAWSEARPAAYDLLERLQENGRRVAVLSNMPASLTDVILATDWASLVDEFFFSGLLGVAKPDPRLYEVVRDGLATPAANLWFIDDKPENLEPARRLGWQTHLWQDDRDTEAWLQESGLL